jgi:hypothetical protein
MAAGTAVRFENIPVGFSFPSNGLDHKDKMQSALVISNEFSSHIILKSDTVSQILYPQVRKIRDLLRGEE